MSIDMLIKFEILTQDEVILTESQVSPSFLFFDLNLINTYNPYKEAKSSLAGCGLFDINQVKLRDGGLQIGL